MKYISTNKKSAAVSFREAVLSGLAPDGGLYVPECIPTLPDDILKKSHLSLHESAFEIAKRFTDGELEHDTLQSIIQKAINFPIPVIPIAENIFCMELFHGPTLAFKDVGARFMAEVLSHFISLQNRPITILTATSGDTGSAVANAFYLKQGIRVVVLYPENGVSLIQEKQMTTLGENISPIAIKGTFDDCQRLVKQAFTDQHLLQKLNLTSANSINIARLIPQAFYYLYAYFVVKKHADKIVFSVPSGNLGNLCAGLIAKKMGMKAHFISANNQNKVFTDYINEGLFAPKPSVKTISNAMDVGNPSNFSRIMYLYDQNRENLLYDIRSCSVDDYETQIAMRDALSRHNYLFDPHGAVAYAAYHRLKEQEAGIILATAHPGKFSDVVEDATTLKPNIPEPLQQALKKETAYTKLKADFTDLKEFLLSLSA